MSTDLQDRTAEALEALTLALLPKGVPAFAATQRKPAPDPDTFSGYLVIASIASIDAADDDHVPAIATAEIQIFHYAADQDSHLAAQRAVTALPSSIFPGCAAIAALDPPNDGLLLYSGATWAAPPETTVTDARRLTLSAILTLQLKPLLVTEI